MIHLVEYDCSGEVFLSRERFSLFELFSRKVVLGRKTLNETGLSHRTDFREYALKGGDVETVLAVPLNVETNTIGAVVLLDYMDRPESSLMVDGLQAVANRLGAEINRKQTLEKLKKERNFTMAVLNCAGPLFPGPGTLSRFIDLSRKLDPILISPGDFSSSGTSSVSATSWYHLISSMVSSYLCRVSILPIVPDSF